MRTVLVVLHAAPGVVGLLAGVMAFSPPRSGDGRAWWRQLYAACILVLIAGLVALIAYDWAELDQIARLTFVGLLGLGVVMAARLLLARRLARSGAGDWQRRYIDHMYFTYVALWIGFLIVPAIGTPWPQVAVPLVVVAVLAAGAVLLSRYKRRTLGV